MELSKKEQKNSVSMSLVRNRDHYTGVRYQTISLYAWDDPISENEAAILVAECQELFNISELKAKYLLMRITQKGWSKQKFEDAIAHAFDTNKIPTKNVGMEPGVILSYEKEIKLHDYGEYCKDTSLMGCQIEGLPGHWWVDSQDYHELNKRDLIK